MLVLSSFLDLARTRPCRSAALPQAFLLTAGANVLERSERGRVGEVVEQKHNGSSDEMTMGSMRVSSRVIWLGNWINSVS